MKKRLLALLCALSIFVPSLALAANDANKDAVVYGAALNNEQINQVNQAFGVTSNDPNLAYKTATGNDLQKYLGYYTDNSNMISSVYIKKLPENSGIKVNIVTPANITSITPGQYTNAAITAGITDADIYVASPKPVTGESALVGVYAALANSGKDIDPERAKVAQEELEAVNEITEENKDKSGFDAADLDKVVIEVKQKLAEHKEETGQAADANQINIYIQDALKNVNLENVLSDNNINILVNFFEKYQNSSAINSKEVRENLIKFGNELADNAGKFYNENKDTIDNITKEAQDSGLLDSILNFFRSIVNSFINIFGSSNDSQN
ncbi:DUF1002 domain-containing protein [Anaerococcus cruorum]|uniref:DUF1002 domain-containing protein n=1 Tax=Anaerococcus sp. WGS1596 TaxID=3366806 RepID=UPI00372D6469